MWKRRCVSDRVTYSLRVGTLTVCSRGGSRQVDMAIHREFRNNRPFGNPSAPKLLYAHGKISLPADGRI